MPRQPHRVRRTTPPWPASALAIAAASVAVAAQEAPPRAASGTETWDAVAAGVPLLLKMQEGESRAEWPYEGVYRVREGDAPQPIIPIGYRVGGTSIAAMALIEAPGYVEDGERQLAVSRALEFVADSINHPLMGFESIPGTYDVRGWGYTYGLSFLLRLKRDGLVVAVADDRIEKAIRFFIDGIEATDIPEAGGWNYARGGGFDQPGAMSPFMTAPTLLALFEAREQGYEVDSGVVERALDSLATARLPTGAYVYSGTASGRNERSQVPGAAARMAASEAALFLAGRSTVDHVRGAIDAFIVHWDWLDQRRAQNGTHVGPYGIAPYYFYFGHYYAAVAIELLPEQDREEYRRRLHELVFRNRLQDGTWNDRVFPRSANYGTAMCLMSLMMKGIEPPARWKSE